jgi:hypothetical protein
MAAGGAPVSWLLIRPGWGVRSSDGEDVGTVDAVTGDSEKDIFDGLAVGGGLFSPPRYVTAAQVAAIAEGTVTLSIPAADVERLPHYDAEPSAAISSEPASVLDRARSWLTGGPDEGAT